MTKFLFLVENVNIKRQKQSFGDILKKSCSENMLQVYKRIPMAKCDLLKSLFSMGVLL